MFENFLKTAIRHLVRNKIHSAINIGGFALGIAVFILIMMYVHNEFTTDKFHKNHQRIHKLGINWYTSVHGPLADLLNSNFPEIQNTARISRHYGRSQLIKYSPPGKEEQIYSLKDIIFCDPSMFEIFTFDIVYGNAETALSEPFSLVLTESESKKIFGSENPVGRIVRYDNQFDFIITAIIKDSPLNSSLIYNGFAPLSNIIDLSGDNQIIDNWHSPNFETYLLLTPDCKPDDLEHKINEFYGDLLMQLSNEEVETDDEVKLHPLQENYFRADLKERTKKGNKSSLYIFITVACMVLVVAIVNFINLATARASLRAREIGVRKAFGSHRFNLICQFVIESTVISLLAIITGLIIAEFLKPVFNNLTGLNLQISYLKNPSILFIFIAGGISIGIVSGIYPAFYLSYYKPVSVLKTSLLVPRFSRGKGQMWFRRILSVFQFTVTICLLIILIFSFKQLEFVKNKDLGINKDNILWFELPDEIKNQYNAFKNELIKNSNILKVSNSNSVPGYRTEGWGRQIEGKVVVFQVIRVDSEFLEIFDLKITDGRKFSDVETQGNILFNETAVREFELESPVGTPVSSLGQITGIVKDFHYRSMHHDIDPIALIYYSDFQGIASVRVVPDSMNETLEYIQETWKEFSHDYPFDYHFLVETFDALYDSEEKFGEIFFFFTILAILLTCLGLFGLVSFTAETRSKEVCIRKIHGAQLNRIFIFMTKEIVLWIFISFFIAGPAGYFVIQKWLQNFEYRTNISWWIFIAAGIITFLTALLAISAKIFETVRRNPADVLRDE